MPPATPTGHQDQPINANDDPLAQPLADNEVTPPDGKDYVATVADDPSRT